MLKNQFAFSTKRAFFPILLTKKRALMNLTDAAFFRAAPSEGKGRRAANFCEILPRKEKERLEF